MRAKAFDEIRPVDNQCDMSRRGWILISAYLAALPLLALGVVVSRNWMGPWWRDQPAVGTLTEVGGDSAGERQLIFITGAGPWPGVAAPQPYVGLARIPESLIRGLLFQEDQAFYEHSGYSLREMYIVTRDFLLYGQRLRGASTLSQQLARTIFLSSERSARRKLLEFRMARVLETRLEKNTILELYFNHVYWGGDARGIAAATRYYFRRPVETLTRAEAAFLVAILPNPNACAPLRGGDLKNCRNAGVLRRMERIVKHLERERDSGPPAEI